MRLVSDGSATAKLWSRFGQTVDTSSQHQQQISAQYASAQGVGVRVIMYMGGQRHLLELCDRGVRVHFSSGTLKYENTKQIHEIAP
jgi:hypothetical protein